MSAGRFGITFAALFIAWVAFTGSLAYQELIVGALAAAFISIFTFKDVVEGEPHHKLHPLRWFYFIEFLLYILYREIISHIKVIAIILSPRLIIKPEIHKIHTTLKNHSALTLLGNSITLTPGTLTLDVQDSDVLVHCITKTPEEKVYGKTAEILKGVSE